MVRYSSRRVMGEATRPPTCPIQSWTPCPTPGTNRPGKIRCRVATSMAVRATLRSGAGIRPIPTRRRCVEANAVAALAIPLCLKQSSQTQRSSRCSSAARARGTIASGGRDWGEYNAECGVPSRHRGTARRHGFVGLGWPRERRRDGRRRGRCGAVGRGVAHRRPVGPRAAARRRPSQRRRRLPLLAARGDRRGPRHQAARLPRGRRELGSRLQHRLGHPDRKCVQRQGFPHRRQTTVEPSRARW